MYKERFSFINRLYIHFRWFHFDALKVIECSRKNNNHSLMKNNMWVRVVTLVHCVYIMWMWNIQSEPVDSEMKLNWTKPHRAQWVNSQHACTFFPVCVYLCIAVNYTHTHTHLYIWQFRNEISRFIQCVLARPHESHWPYMVMDRMLLIECKFKQISTWLKILLIVWTEFWGKNI